METPHTIVYLFSKYSKACNSFTDLINSANIDYLSPVCVDNKEVRNRILNSKFNIQSLPCLLFIYSVGNIEKFEGDSCFRWAEELRAKMQPVFQPQPILPQSVTQPSLTQIIEPEEKLKKSKKKKKIEPESSDESSDEEIVVKKNKKDKVTKNKIDVSKISLPNLTDINDLLGDVEELTDKKDIEFQDLTSTTTDMMRNTAEKGGKKEHKNSGTMALAQEMQKMRENMDSGNKKPPFP
jgi:hypothetical protein